MSIKVALKLEELFMFVLGFLGFLYFGGTIILFIVVIFFPDLGMLGYLINPLIGSYTYNTTHNKALAIIIFLIGALVANNLLIFTGLIIFSHSSLDRVLGYGLKLRGSFNNTHLGKIGKGT